MSEIGNSGVPVFQRLARRLARQLRSEGGEVC